MTQDPPRFELNEIANIDNGLDLVVGQTAKKRDFIPHFPNILHPDLHADSPSWGGGCLAIPCADLFAEDSHRPLEPHQGQRSVAAGSGLLGL